ncbi:hypothetical protein VTK26DRAFT_5420 [Humicola hyalothermophila]
MYTHSLTHLFFLLFSTPLHSVCMSHLALVHQSTHLTIYDQPTKQRMPSNSLTKQTKLTCLLIPEKPLLRPFAALLLASLPLPFPVTSAMSRITLSQQSPDDGGTRSCVCVCVCLFDAASLHPPFSPFFAGFAFSGLLAFVPFCPAAVLGETDAGSAPPFRKPRRGGFGGGGRGKGAVRGMVI